MIENPKVFTDFHHASLLNSLIMLFEYRLGGQLFRPIGTEWYEQGFWKIYDHPATVQQFLGIGGATPDGTPRLNDLHSEVENIFTGEGIYYCQDIDSGFYNKAITFDRFMKENFDIVIASIPAHIEPFKKLCELHPNKPRLIFQIGNAWTVEAGLAPNVMASAIINDVPDHINFISYHQEFDLNVFTPNWPLDVLDSENSTPPENKIYSFVNCFNIADYMAHDFQLFEKVERLMSPDWSFKSFGGQCRDGAKHGSEELSDAMREAKFIWHTKAGGDGYGHIIYNSAAVARPMITKKSYYEGKMGAELMIDGVTCINVDNLSPSEIVDKINYYSEPERYREMCFNVYENFQKRVDFNNEAERISAFLEKLI